MASAMRLEPANATSVTAGAPVTFSGESNQALTFSVASSPALLSSPDVDSGTGSQSEVFYRFTSTKATAIPRTIYWTASFTSTPEDCESAVTFTTPVYTLTVVPSEAELAAAKARQEEEEAVKNAATKARQEEEAAKKKQGEIEAAGRVVLDSLTIDIKNAHKGTLELTCSDVAACAGKLTLTANATVGKGKARHAKTETIGTASFSITSETSTPVEFMINGVGRTLLGTSHGHLSAALTIMRSSPSPAKIQTVQVRLEEQKPAKAKR
ncbi:MAG TPA: hypothetical protein VIH71_05230 [Solirubrobacteraceae bacterium]